MGPSVGCFSLDVRWILTDQCHTVKNYPSTARGIFEIPSMAIEKSRSAETVPSSSLPSVHNCWKCSGKTQPSAGHNPLRQTQHRASSLPLRCHHRQLPIRNFATLEVCGARHTRHGSQHTVPFHLLTPHIHAVHPHLFRLFPRQYRFVSQYINWQKV